MKKNSDIDFLVRLPKNASLLQLVGLKPTMQKALGKSADIIEYSTLRPSVRQQILKEEVVLI